MIDENEIIDGCNILFNGRLFSVKWKQVNKVIVRPVDDIGFIEAKYDALETVLITPEILLNIGFEKMNESDFLYTLDDKKYEVRFSGENKPQMIINGNHSITNLSGLHHLQKIIFDQSGHCLSIIEKTVD